MCINTGLPLGGQAIIDPNNPSSEQNLSPASYSATNNDSNAMTFIPNVVQSNKNLYALSRKTAYLLLGSCAVIACAFVGHAVGRIAPLPACNIVKSYADDIEVGMTNDTILDRAGMAIDLSTEFSHSIQLAEAETGQAGHHNTVAKR